MLFLQNMLSFVIIYLSLRESESSFGKVFTFEKAQPDLPPRGRGTARRRWKEFSQAVEGVSHRSRDGRSSRMRWKALPANPLQIPKRLHGIRRHAAGRRLAKTGAVKAARDGRLNPGLRILDNEAFFRLHADEIRRHQENLRVGLAPGDVRSVGNRVEIIAQPQPRQDEFRVLARRADRQLQPMPRRASSVSFTSAERSAGDMFASRRRYSAFFSSASASFSCAVSFPS